MDYKRIHVIINPASGNNEPILNSLNDAFKPLGTYWDVSITHHAGDGAKYAREALEKDYDLIMAYGGDGTILDVAEGLIYADVPLAILPGGTANALADDLGLPPRLQPALALYASGLTRVRPIDVGQTGNRHFLLRVGTGMIATFSEVVTREMKDRFGIGAYIIGGIQAMTNPQYVTYRLMIDGEPKEIQGIACLITNGNAIGALGIRLSKYVSIDDGLLDVFVLNSDLPSVLGMAASIAQVDELTVPLQHWQGREITVEADPPQGVYGDGEEIPFDQTPSTARALKGALKVLVPA